MRTVWWLRRPPSFLRRTPLTINTDLLEPGVYAPSEVFLAPRAEGCPFLSDQLRLDKLQKAIVSGKVSAFIHKSASGPFDDVPREKSSLELLNEQYRRDPFAELLEKEQNRTKEYSRCSDTECRSLEACQIVPYRGNTLSASDEFELHDLRYVVVATANSVGKCCLRRDYRRNSALEPSTKDLGMLKAEAESRSQVVALAGAKYSQDEVMRLLFLLPVRLQNAADSDVGLPAVLTDFISKIFSEEVLKIAGRFASPGLSTLKVIYDAGDIVDGAVRSFGGWYEAQSPSSGSLIYMSPLLARAPFYLCYNKGVSNFVDVQQRYSRGDGAWLEEFHQSRCTSDSATPSVE